MDVPRRTGTLLVYAGTIGVATTFLLCVYLHDILNVLRGWYCTRDGCTIPPQWTFEQTRDLFLLWFGGARSVLQIRAGMHLQNPEVNPRNALVAYLVVAALDCAALASLQQLPAWTLALAVGWPLFVFALTRTASVRPYAWESVRVPRARVIA